VAVRSAILATAWLLVLYGFTSSVPVIGNSPLLYLYSPSVSCRQFFGGLPYNLYCVGGDVIHCSINQPWWTETHLFKQVYMLQELLGITELNWTDQCILWEFCHQKSPLFWFSISPQSCFLVFSFYTRAEV